MKSKEINLRPEDRRDRWEVFSDTKPYQSMSESQRMIFDHAEENGMRGAKRYTKADIDKWQEKRASMAEEEIAEMEAKAERKGDKMGKGFLVVVGAIIILSVIACIWIAG